MPKTPTAAAEHQNEIDPIVSYNLTMLSSSAFRDVLGSESVGGNAGVAVIAGEPMITQAVNGYADRRTGQISIFGNSQYIDEEIKGRDILFTLRMVTSYNSWERRVAQLFFDDEGISPEGKDRLFEAARLYNQQAAERAAAAIARHNQTGRFDPLQPSRADK